MATDDLSATAAILTKRPISRNQRVLNRSQSTRKPRFDDFRVKRTKTATSRSSSKLPNLLAKVSIDPPTAESMQFRRYRSLERDQVASASSKLERQSTIINPQARLSTFYSLTNDEEQRRISEFRRRQIYALNHLMRDLEQDQFRQFCKSNNVSADQLEYTANNNEDTTKKLLT